MEVLDDWVGRSFGDSAPASSGERAEGRDQWCEAVYEQIATKRNPADAVGPEWRERVKGENELPRYWPQKTYIVVGRESDAEQRLNSQLVVAPERYLRPQIEVEEAFAELATEWETETLVVSSPSEAALHPAYQRIIGLGLQVVPSLLKRLRETRRYWFWALAAITGDNPAAGTVDADCAIAAWLQWGREAGFFSGD